MYCGRCGMEIDYDKTKIIQDGETIEVHYYAKCPKCKDELGEKEIFHHTCWDYLTTDEWRELKKMNERVESKKIRVYAVVPYEQWNYVKNDEIEKQYLNDYDYWQECDYAVTAIMVEESLIFLDDNMHNHPDNVLEGIIAGLEKFFPLSLTKEVLLLDENINEYNKTKVQEAIYNKWKSGN